MNEEDRKKCSENKLAEKNPMWKGDAVGRGALHTWIRKRKPRLPFCEECKQPKTWLDLANKGTYDRNLKNWEWLCRRCHMTKDGRILFNSNPKTGEYISCIICGKSRYVRKWFLENRSPKYCSHKCYRSISRGK